MLRNRVEALLASQGCSLDEWRVLDHVAGHGPSVMSTIGRDAGLAPSALSKVVDRLVTNNVLYRRIDPADRRRINVHLTSRGRSVHRQCVEVLDRADSFLDTAAQDALATLSTAVENALTTLEVGQSDPTEIVSRAENVQLSDL
ncbi:hypothetical protein BH10ACT9_BH10ACT9_52610 [soil metagenome]